MRYIFPVLTGFNVGFCAARIGDGNWHSAGVFGALAFLAAWGWCVMRPRGPGE